MSLRTCFQILFLINTHSSCIDIYIYIYITNNSQPEGLGVAFFATGPCLGLIMYILTTLEFPTHYFNFHLYIYIYMLFPISVLGLAFGSLPRKRISEK